MAAALDKQIGALIGQPGSLSQQSLGSGPSLAVCQVQQTECLQQRRSTLLHEPLGLVQLALDFTATGIDSQPALNL